MKINLRLSFMAMLLISMTAFGQIPNNGFENWTDDGSDNNPDFWITSNSDPFVCVSPYSPAYAGNFSMKVGTFSPGFGILPGIAELDFNYSQRPNFLKACIKTNIAPGDKVILMVSMFQGDSIVASPLFCSFNVDTNINEFTCMYFPISYLSSLIPDSVNITIAAGMGNTQMGTYIIVDELSFEDALDLAEMEKNPLTQLFPNPFTDKLTITSEITDKIELINLRGEVISVPVAVHEGYSDLDTSKLPEGIYVVHVSSKNGLVSFKVIK